MRIEITRSVVNDLWSLERTGQASPESRAVIKEYLAADPDFRSVLDASEQLTSVTPQVRVLPDADRQLLDLTVARLQSRTILWATGIASVTVLLIVVIGAMLFLVRPGG